MSYRKIPARASHSWPVPLQGEPFSLVTFLLGLAKESNPAASADGSSALACGFSISKIKIKRQKLPPLKRRVTFFCLKQQKSVWIPFGQKSPKKNAFL
ncbi:hypothetical protein [Lysobacter sp. ESA13C]|uniref:hypothetical protein n=1 Tax=Lysobacter sp. ESA13C TaxID=2862676 RepID=UPI001CBBD198|nr:hypothetical protein [Lysobacter sp. ESA13C]